MHACELYAFAPTSANWEYGWVSRLTFLVYAWISDSSLLGCQLLEDYTSPDADDISLAAQLRRSTDICASLHLRLADCESELAQARSRGAAAATSCSELQAQLVAQTERLIAVREQLAACQEERYSLASQLAVANLALEEERRKRWASWSVIKIKEQLLIKRMLALGARGGALNQCGTLPVCKTCKGTLIPYCSHGAVLQAAAAAGVDGCSNPSK